MLSVGGMISVENKFLDPYRSSTFRDAGFRVKGLKIFREKSLFSSKRRYGRRPVGPVYMLVREENLEIAV